MRRPLAVVAFVLLAGCTGTTGSDYFPSLPDGCSYTLGPDKVDTSRVMGEEDDFGQVPKAAWLAQVGCADGDGGIIVAEFEDAARSKMAAAALSECDEDDLFHILQDGAFLILVGVGDEAVQDEMDDVAARIAADTGADVQC